MCGVCGVVDFSAPVDPVRVQWMCDFLAHRGPDDSGIWADPACVLGSRRLAIVDVADGRQPAANEDGTVQVVFNGEITRPSADQALARSPRAPVRSGSDVEVIRTSMRNGVWTSSTSWTAISRFGLWDAKVRRLVLTRDRVGVKPLFYHVDGERLIFASEIKGVFASGLCPITMDPQGLSDCFFYSHTVGPSTFWMGVRDLSPAQSCASIPAVLRFSAISTRWSARTRQSAFSGAERPLNPSHTCSPRLCKNASRTRSRPGSR